MSAVVGIDLSSKALDLVKLDEDSNRAEWVRCELHGKDAWERTLHVRENLYLGPPRTGDMFLRERFWDDVYLVAIEAPYGSGQPGTQAILNRVVGAVAASLPAHLRAPERCWIVRPDEWKAHHGLKGKPTTLDLVRLVGTSKPFNVVAADEQNARDAYCLAMYCRDTNAAAIRQADVA